jgi:hypothetical protein
MVRSPGSPPGGCAPKVDYAAGAKPSSVAVADLDGDQHPDLVVTDLEAGSVAVLTGNGDGTFQAKVDHRTGKQPSSVAVADVNGDAIPDLVVANAGAATLSVLLGAGGGAYKPKVDYPTGGRQHALLLPLLNGPRMGVGYPTDGRPTSVVVADVSGDGKPDLVAASSEGEAVSVLIGNGDGISDRRDATLGRGGRRDR